MIYNQGIKDSITLFANAEAAAAYIASHEDFASDPYNTYSVFENADGKAVIKIIDEDGFELGVL